MVPNMGKNILTIRSCKNMSVKFNVNNIGPPVKRVIRSSGIIKIPTKFNSTNFFKLRGNGLPTGRDFMFIPKRIDQLGNDGGIFFNIVDINTALVQIINTNPQNVYLFKTSKLNIVQNYKKENCYLTNEKDTVFLTVNFCNYKPTETNWFKKIVKAGIMILTVYQAVVNSVTEFVISTGITVYGDIPIIQIQLADVTEVYPRLWENDGSTVRVPPEKCMSIDTLPDVKIKTIEIYPLKPIDRQMVDDIFDKLHEQRRMEYTTQPTFHGYPVFVVWRRIRKERKKRVVINIRGFNKITVTNFYPMPLQSDIIFIITGCQYISVFDVTGFFHQWLIRVIDRHEFIVVSHRNQKQFNVAIMGFKNSPPYIQK